MSEANSIAGTVGTWIGGLIVLFVLYLVAYKLRHITTSSDENTHTLLGVQNRDLAETRASNEAILRALLKIEEIALEVRNEPGDVLVVQGVPYSSAQMDRADIQRQA